MAASARAEAAIIRFLAPSSDAPSPLPAQRPRQPMVRTAPSNAAARPTNRFGLPDLGIGVGLRTTHYQHILDERPDVAWFEIISENYMQTAGRPLHILDRIAERHPIVMHGVSLSIGSTDPLDRGYLADLKALRDRVQAPWVS